MNTEVVLEAGIRTEESLRMVERGGSRVMEKLETPEPHFANVSVVKTVASRLDHVSRISVQDGTQKAR